MILLDELRRVTEHGHGDRFAELGKRLGVVVEPDEFVDLCAGEPTLLGQLVQTVPVVAVHGDERIKVHRVSVAWRP